MAKSVYDGQDDEQAIVHRTRAILAKKGLRLEKVSAAQAAIKAQHGYGPYMIIGGAPVGAGGKVVAEGLGIEEIETKAEELPVWGLPQQRPVASSTPEPSAPLERVAQLEEQVLRLQQKQQVKELEAEIRSLKQQVKERDMMIAFLRQQQRG